MTYTLGTAAKATGKSKPTIQRAIKKGQISATKDALGQWQIDAAELHRVYPAVEQGNTQERNETERSETPNNTSMLRREIEVLNERVAEKDTYIEDLREDRNKWREQARGLLTDQRPKPAENRSVWPWLAVGAAVLILAGILVVLVLQNPPV